MVLHVQKLYVYEFGDLCFMLKAVIPCEADSPPDPSDGSVCASALE